MTLLILLMWAISIVTNILNPIGMISFCFLLGEGGLDFTLPLIIGGIGFVYGLLTWGFTVPPRLLFWTGSLFGLFEMRLGSAIGNGITFFNSTIAIIVLSDLF